MEKEAEKPQANSDFDKNSDPNLNKEVDLDKFLETIKIASELLSKWEYLIKPLMTELEEVHQELFEHQYPGIKPYRQIWHINWVKEAMSLHASQLANRLIHFFEQVEKDEDYKNGYDDYQRSLDLYLHPYEAKRMFFDGDRSALSPKELDIIDTIYENSYQEDVIGMAELNKLKVEYEQAVLSPVLNFYEDEYHALSPDQKINYNLIVGICYSEYFDDCKELDYYLIKKNMVEFPGVSYHQFLLDESKRYLNENNTQKSEQKKLVVYITDGVTPSQN